jgi:hypothetical protein
MTLREARNVAVATLAFALVPAGCGGNRDGVSTGAVPSWAETATAAGPTHGGSLDAFIHEPYVIIYLRTDTSESDVTTFIDTVLMEPPVPSERGQDLADGLLGAGGFYTDRAAWAEFAPTASDEQRRAVLDAIGASPLFERLGTADELVDGFPPRR